MSANQLVLRCYAEKKSDNVWVAICIDLCLAAQAETFDDVRTKLDSQIDSYLQEAMVGEDREYVDQLVPRRAPFKFFLKYYLSHLRVFMRNNLRDFLRVVPLQPHGA